MTSDVVTLAFIIGAIVLLALLWRRGPEKRGAFFVAGLLTVAASLVLAATEDALDEGLGDWYGEFRAGWAARPPEALMEATGVSITFRGDVDVAQADPRDHGDLYPEPESPLQWQPLYSAEGPKGGCSLVDATDYAAALGPWSLEDALAHELDGLEEGRVDTLLARISRPLAGIKDDGVTSGYLDLPASRAAYVDVENAGGFTRRHYIVRERGRWVVLTCFTWDANEVPEDRWQKTAESIVVEAYPSVEVALGDLVPFKSCRERQPNTVARSDHVMTCRTDGNVEVTYAGFPDRDELAEWWAAEAGSVPAVAPDEASRMCQSGESAAADHAGVRFLCHKDGQGIWPRVSWADEDRLIGGIATSPTAPLPDIYSRWSQGEFELGLTEPVEKPESTQGPATTEPTTKPTTEPAVEAHAFAGLFPSSWTVEPADPDAHSWLFPAVEDDVHWQPVAYATDGTDECTLIDATTYADELGFDTVEDALEWELAGFDEDAARAWARLVSVTSLSNPEIATGKYLVWALEEIAFVDVESESGEFGRHYLHYDGTRWVYFSCRSSDPPDDRWLPRALAVSYEPFEQLVQLVPTTAPPTPSPHLAQLRGLVPLKACDSRPAETETGALAVLACVAADDIDIDYAVFANRADLEAWYDHQVGTVQTTQDGESFEVCEDGEAAESDWFLNDDESIKGRFVCRPGTPASDPRLAWIDETALLGGRATSAESDLSALYTHWFHGDYDPDHS